MGFLKQVAGNFVPNKSSIGNATGVLARVAGQTALSAAFPDQYEAYHLVLQLIDPSSTSAPIQSFNFPVMPESLALAQRYLMTVTPTLDGNFVDDFGQAPSPIQLSGTFGKKLRTVVGPGINSSLIRNASAATGFGMAKSLSEFVELSHRPTSVGLMPKTVLFNWAFDSHWEVTINSLDIQMSVQQNGLWFYNLSLTCLRPWGSPGDFNLDTIISSVLGSVLNNTAGTSIATAIAAVSAVNTVKDWIQSARVPASS